MFKITDLQRLKIRRFINRHKNGAVEQILKLIEKLQKQLEALDAEQDAANAAMKAEQARIKERTAHHVAELQAQIEQAERQAIADTATAEETFGAIAKEAAADAEKVRTVQKNVKALTTE